MPISRIITSVYMNFIDPIIDYLTFKIPPKKPTLSDEVKKKILSKKNIIPPIKPTVKKEMISRMVDRQPINKMGEPHDLKGAAALFASPAGNWITGQNLIVDGGWTTF